MASPNCGGHQPVGWRHLNIAHSVPAEQVCVADLHCVASKDAELLWGNTGRTSQIAGGSARDGACLLQTASEV